MKKLITIILSLTIASLATAQSKSIDGRVTDENGDPIAYANLNIREKLIGATADKSGYYTLTLPDGNTYTLEASFGGYTTVARKVSVTSDPSDFNFVLKENMTELNTFVIVGTRTPVMLKDTPVQTRIISSSDIAKVDATNIVDILRAELPSIEFTKSMGQQEAVINIQGFGGTSVLFLIDGERIAGETLDNPDYSRLNMTNIERIEIVRGVASSLYGSNALGGVINIITKKANEPWQVNVNSRYGSHNSWRNGISVGLSQGRFNSVTDFQHTSQDAYQLDETTKYYGNRTYNIRQRLIYYANKKLKFTGRGGYFFRERFAGGTGNERARAFTGGLKTDYRVGDRQDLEVSYLYDQYDKSDYYTTTQQEVRDYSNRQHNLRVMYNFREIWDNAMLTIGGDALSDYLMSYQFENNGSRKQYSADLFSQLDWHIGKKINIIGGVRGDYFSKVGKLNISPKIAVMYKDGPCALRASYGEGFRAPTLKEMYMDFFMGNIFMIYGNPDLKTETSHNFLLSAEYLKSRVNFNVNGSYNIKKNRIGIVWMPELNGQKYINNRRVDIFGAEANLKLKLPMGFGFKASYAFTREIMHYGEVNASATRPHTAVGQFEYGKTFKNYEFNVTLAGRFMSAVDTNQLIMDDNNDFIYEPIHYKGYMMWKLIINQRLWRAVSVTASVDNLLGYQPKFYTDNTPLTKGRTYSVGISINIEQLFKQ